MLDRQEKNIKELDNDLQYILLWRARLLKEKDNVLTIYFIIKFFGKVFERKTDKYCSILKSHYHKSKANRVINLDMAKVLKEERFNVLPGQKLCRQCVTKYEKLTKPPENENMTEIIDTEFTRRISISDDDFLLYESPKKKLDT